MVKDSMIDIIADTRRRQEAARDAYTPHGHIDILPIVESPPAALERLLYYEDVEEADYLYTHLVKALFEDARTRDVSEIRREKRIYLERFMNEKKLLELDVLTIPIQGGTRRQKIQEIRAGLPNLLDRINTYDGIRKPGVIDGNTKIILIKKTVFAAIADSEEWRARGLNVVNRIEAIPFPSNGHQREFLARIAKYL